MLKILFYLAQEYYWPSLKPVYDAFATNEEIELFINIDKNSKRYFKIFLVSQRGKIEKKFVDQGYQVTREEKGFDAVFCGAQIKNPHRFGDALLCNVDHGPGIKTLRYRHFLKQPDTQYICFLEGPYRVEKFKKYGLDKIEKIYDVGLPKLDVFFNGHFDKDELVKKYNLDPAKKTILYAPSYKPTSIFMIGEQICRLAEQYNVIVKLHPYSWNGKYAPHSQHELFEKLQTRFPYMRLVAESSHDIMPYMFVADTMISDGSSVINEFLSLGRCGIIVDLEDDALKHSDGQPLLEDRSSDWLKDSFVHISDAEQLQDAIEQALNPSPARKKNIEKDKNYIFSFTDGNAAVRVKEKTLELLNRR
ncbi:MAG: CDP-glycerol glycerophosphotransferase family protein [Calditrichae bacterium]|nr:CDP-glycerol glycerophosphotransferase family protein [Calditrichota bacterium]MCB9057389.1 CDP-glycerol glycerophosphotransferase family protein [Calditrichia bacterium]